MTHAGRPTKRTPKTEALILEYIGAGTTKKAAAQAAGISQDTFCEWVKQFPEFSEAVTRAESVAEAGYAAVLRKAAMGYEATDTVETTSVEFKKRRTTTTDPATGAKSVTEEEVPHTIKRITTTTRREFDWRAAESWLKRRRKDDWSDRVETTGKDGGPLAEIPITRIIVYKPAGVGDDE